MLSTDLLLLLQLGLGFQFSQTWCGVYVFWCEVKASTFLPARSYCGSFVHFFRYILTNVLEGVQYAGVGSFENAQHAFCETPGPYSWLYSSE
jgi:hypothetical protein